MFRFSLSRSQFLFVTDFCVCIHRLWRPPRHPGEVLSIGKEYVAATLCFPWSCFPPSWLMEELVLWGLFVWWRRHGGQSPEQLSRGGLPHPRSLLSCLRTECRPTGVPASAFPPKLSGKTIQSGEHSEASSELKLLVGLLSAGNICLCPSRGRGALRTDLTSGHFAPSFQISS